MFFRSTDRSDCLQYVVSGDGNKSCYVEAHEPGKTRWLKSYDFSLQERQWYTAHVEVRGRHIACFLKSPTASGKGICLFEIDDDRHPRGRVGLQTFAASVRFKNIKVTAPDGGVLWEGPPAIDSTTPAERTTPAQQTKPAVDGRDGFVQVFNGKNLDGWFVDSGPRDSWRVDAAGNLVVTGPNNWRKSGFLLTNREYADFVLRFDFLPDANTNSGVAIRARPGELFEGLAHHPQIELFDADKRDLKNGVVHLVENLGCV